MTAKSDVYSFGVVLLEMLSGRRAVDKNRPPGEHNLVEWSKPYLANKRKLFRIVDNRLEGQYTVEEAHKVAGLALRCLSIDSKFRPTMTDVVKVIELLHETREKEGVQGQKIKSNGVPQNKGVRRRSSDDASVTRKRVSYPRPSASPVYA